MSTAETIANALLQVGAVGFTPDAPKTFKSGMLSPVYVDNRRLPFHPDAWRAVIEGFQAVATTLPHDAVAGVAVGGVPHSAALGYVMGIPSLFVRKEAKGHGLDNMVEGGDVAGKRVLLVEDLVTTGSSSLAGVAALRHAQAIVTDTIAIVSYGFPEAEMAFSNAAVQLHTLTTFQHILDAAQSKAFFDERSAALIRDWFASPVDWGDRHKLDHQRGANT